MKTSPHRISIWFFVFGLFLVVIALTTFEEKMDRSRRLKEIQSLEATFGPTPPAVHTVQEINGIKLAWQKAGIYPASFGADTGFYADSGRLFIRRAKKPKDVPGLAILNGETGTLLYEIGQHYGIGAFTSSNSWLYISQNDNFINRIDLNRPTQEWNMAMWAQVPTDKNPECLQIANGKLQSNWLNGGFYAISLKNGQVVEHQDRSDGYRLEDGIFYFSLDPYWLLNTGSRMISGKQISIGNLTMSCFHKRYHFLKIVRRPRQSFRT